MRLLSRADTGGAVPVLVVGPATAVRDLPDVSAPGDADCGDLASLVCHRGEVVVTAESGLGSSDDALTAAVEAVQGKALVALADPGRPVADATVPLTAHLGAALSVIYPAAEQTIPETRVGLALRDQRMGAETLLDVIRRVEASSAREPGGDSAVALRHHLRGLFLVHAWADQLLLERLARAVGGARTAALAHRYERAVRGVGPARQRRRALFWRGD